MFTDSLPFVEMYVEWLDESLRAHSPGQKLTRIQKLWLGF